MTKDDFTTCYQCYADSVYRLSLFITGQKEDAQDIVQQTFLKLYRDKPVFEQESQKKSWLFITARNASYDLLKSSERRKRHIGDGMGQLELHKQHAYREPGQEYGEDTSILFALSWEYRVVLYLFYYEEYSTREIAKILGISETAVRGRLTRGRKKLKMKLER